MKPRLVLPAVTVGQAPGATYTGRGANLAAYTYFWIELARSLMPRKAGVRGILVDLDGVLYDADRLIAGAADTVRWLQTQGIPHLFVTNTTSKSRVALAEKLASFGIPAGEAEILTPAVAAAEWLRVNGTGEIALFVRPSAHLDFRDLPCLPDDAERGAAYVVLGDLGDLWDYWTLNRAFRLLFTIPKPSSSHWA